MGISVPALKLIESFLCNSFQRVILNGQSSNWLPVKTGILQGSILGPLFFNFNDLSDNLTATVQLCSLYFCQTIKSRLAIGFRIGMQMESVF